MPAPPSRTVLISLASRPDRDKLDPLLDALRRQRLMLLFIPGSHDVRNDLIRQFGAASVIDPPWNNRASSLIFLLTSRARLILALDGLEPLPSILVKQAYRLGVGLAVIAMNPAQTPGLSPPVDLLLPEYAFHRPAARSLAVARLTELMARRPPARSPLQSLVEASLEASIWRRLVGARASRIETLAALRMALGDPQTILCLGNGPSCEDPALAGYRYDSLFRVNHRWLPRSHHCDPHMVFTGQKRTLFAIRSKPIFAFQTRRAEALLVTHQIFNPLCRRMRFVTLERLGVLGPGDWDGVRPTNGATMVATAVALEPKCIIIAGIDLFEDPAGAYPGDDSTANDYVVVHERQIEVDFIVNALRDYRGKLVILSKPLAARWAASEAETARRAGAMD